MSSVLVKFQAGHFLQVSNPMTHYYESGRPRCQQKCVVRGVVCICELVEGHSGEHEKVPTGFLATVQELENFPVFESFAEMQ
jgi:hypothetical protein